MKDCAHQINIIVTLSCNRVRRHFYPCKVEKKNIVKSLFKSMNVAFYRDLSSNAIAFLPEGIFAKLKNLDSL